MGTEQRSFNWRNRQKDMLNTFQELLLDKDFVDVTLACDGASLEAHKIVLSACSPYFRSLFQKNRCEHPIVIMANIKHRDMKAIVDFMYNGEVSVSRKHITDFLQTADLLKIKGLPATTDGIIHNSDDVMDSDDVHSNISNDMPSTSGIKAAHIPNRLQLSVHNSSVDSETEYSQEVSTYTNDESELMETMIVKSEPEDSYRESPNMESHGENLFSVYDSNSLVSPTTASMPGMDPGMKSVGGKQSSEKQMSQSIPVSDAFPLDRPVCNVGISVSSEGSSLPVLLSENVSPAQTNQDQYCSDVLLPNNISFQNRTSFAVVSSSGYNQGIASQAALVSFEEPKVFVNYGMPINDDKSPMKETACKDFSTSNSNNNTLNIESETGITPNEKVHLVQESGSSLSTSPKRRSDFLQNKSKRKRLCINYTNFSKFGKSMSSQKHVISRPFNPDFDCKCTQQCTKRISAETRMKIFKKFRSMESHKQQDAFIRATVSQENTNYKRKKKYKRNFGRIYKLDGIIVCYQMYAYTLKINTDRINKALLLPRPSSKHIKHRTIKKTKTEKYHGLSDNKITEVIDYFDEFFNFTSHHNSKNVPVEFVSSNLPLQKLYDVYKQNNVFPVTYYHFDKIFKNDFMHSLNKRNYIFTNYQLYSNNDEAKQMEVIPEDKTSRLHPEKQISMESSLHFDSNRETEQHHDTVCSEALLVTKENVPACRPPLRKLTDSKITEVIDHFKKFCNSDNASQWKKIDLDLSDNSQYKKFPLDLSSHNFWKMYKIYKKDVVIPVSFYNYVKIFNNSFKHSLNEKNIRDTTQQPNTNKSSTIQHCNANKTGPMQQHNNTKVGGQQSFSKLTDDKIAEVIDHFNTFCNNATQCKRVGIPVDLSSTDPPLSKMYKVYRKDVTIPISYYHYVKIFNTNFKHSMDERNKTDASQNCNTSIDITHQHSLSHEKQQVDQQKKPHSTYTQNDTNTKVCNSHNNQYDASQEKQGTTNKSHSMCKQNTTDHESGITIPAKQVMEGNQIKPNLADKESIKDKGTEIHSTKSTNQESLDNIAPNRITAVIEHFNEFHNFVSRHNKANVPLEFVNSNLPLMKMYKLYRADATEPVSYYHYFNIFRTNFKRSKDKQEHCGKSKDRHCSSNQPKEGKETLDNRNSESNLINKVFSNDTCQNSKVNNASSQQKLQPAITTAEENSKVHILSEKSNTKITLQDDTYKNIKCQHAMVSINKIEIPLRFQKTILSSKDDEIHISDNDPNNDSVDCVELGAENVMQHDDLNQTEISVKLEVNINEETDHSNSVLNNGSIHSKTVKLTTENETSKLNALHEKNDTSLEQQCNSSIDNGHSSEALNVEDMNIISKLLLEMIDNIEDEKSLIDDMDYIVDQQNDPVEDDSLFTKEMGVSEELYDHASDAFLERSRCADIDVKSESSETNNENYGVLQNNEAEAASQQHLE